MISEFVNDTQLFNEVKHYIDDYFKEYSINKIRQNDDTQGLHHALQAISQAFSSMQKEYEVVVKKKKVDHTV